MRDDGGVPCFPPKRPCRPRLRLAIRIWSNKAISGSSADLTHLSMMNSLNAWVSDNISRYGTVSRGAVRMNPEKLKSYNFPSDCFR